MPDVLEKSAFPADKPRLRTRKWIAADIRRITAGGRGGIPVLTPAVMLSTESIMESVAASIEERMAGFFLFTFSEKEAVVRSFVRWNLSGSASYNL